MINVRCIPDYLNHILNRKFEGIQGHKYIF